MTDFELPPYRPPSESRSLLIRATRGCPWNRCAFCCLYTGVKFEVRTVPEVMQDILEMKQLVTERRVRASRHGIMRLERAALAEGIPWLTSEGVKTAFIGDSNSIAMRTEDLAQIIECLYESFPELERVTSYGRAKTVLQKKPEELKHLRQAGLTRLHVGLETGDDELLKFINKGPTAAEMIEAGRKVKEAGITLSEYVILGLGGRRWWKQHALGTARVLNAINPDFIRVRTLMLTPGMALYDKLHSGEFELASPDEILRETRLLIENLEVTSEFLSDHVSNYVNLNGQLPQDKARLLEEIDRVLSLPPEERSRLVRPETMRRL